MVNSLLDNKYLKNFIQYSLPILIIAFVSRAFPAFSSIYYLIIPLLFSYILLAAALKLYKQIDIKLALIIFASPVYAIITSLWSLYPSISLQRSLYLVFIYAGLLSTVLLYKHFNKELSIKFFIPANVIIILLSLFSLITNQPSDSWSGGNGLGFMGFAGHQNTLAAAILFTLPGVFALMAKSMEHSVSRNNAHKWSFGYALFDDKRQLLFFLLLTFNFLLFILTYSRASWFALLIGIIIFIILTKNIKIILSLISVLIIFLILTLSIPSINVFMESVLQKGDSPIFSRRQILWEPSYEAAKLGGLTGLGFGVSAPSIKTPDLTGSHYENGRYMREKGNSVLAVIEETGLIGLILFLLPVFWVIRKFIIYNFASPQTGLQFTIQNKIKTNYTLYTCLPPACPARFASVARRVGRVGMVLHCTLFALLLHSQFEAWWVGVGSVQLPLFLIYLFLAALYNY